MAVQNEKGWEVGKKDEASTHGRTRKSHPLPRGYYVHFLFQIHSKNISPHLFRDARCHGYWATDAFWIWYVTSSPNLQSDLEQVAIFSYMLLIHALEKSAFSLYLNITFSHTPQFHCPSGLTHLQGFYLPFLQCERHHKDPKIQAIFQTQDTHQEASTSSG